MVIGCGSGTLDGVPSWREFAYVLALPFLVAIGLVHLVLVGVSALLTLNLIEVPLLALWVRAGRSLGAANRW